MSENNPFKILSRSEIKDLKRKGHDLDEEKFYAISFLLNDELNQAADPRPFQIASDFVEPLTKTGMNRPWLPDTLPNGMHIRPKEDATAEEILEFQKEYAGGIMRGYFVNPITHNANVILEIFPEYVEAVRTNKIKPLVSPMVGNWRENESGQIVEGEILHLQSVDSSGYDPKIAKFHGTCKGDFETCRRELAPLAAAGLLKKFRGSEITCPKKFLNTLGATGISMSLPEEQATQSNENPTPDANVVVGELKQKVEQMETKEAEMEAKLEGEIQDVDAKVTQVQADVAEIKSKVVGEKSEDDKTDSSSTETSSEEKPVGAAGQSVTLEKQLKDTQKELQAIRKEREEEKKLLEQKERARQVNIIVKSELISHKLTVENQEKRRKELLEMKDPKNPESLRDISILAEVAEKTLIESFPEEVTENPNTPLGSYGDGYPIPDSTSPTATDYASTEKEILSE